MKEKIIFKCFKEFFETDISKRDEDEMDESVMLNVNKQNWEYLKQTLTKKQLHEMIEKNPSWLEFI